MATARKRRVANKIAFVKTGWSDNYEGGEVIGRHAYISNGNDAYERFNFLKASDGRYYGYLPPIGRNSRPPQPRERQGWLVIFVAARNGNGPLTVVGWYEKATFQIEYTERPEYSSGVGFPTTGVNGSNYIYCVTSSSARLIPVHKRNTIVPGDHFKRSPIVYARGNGLEDDWRQELTKLAERLVNSSASSMPTSNSSNGFPDQEHRNKVEKAAIREAERYLKSKRYEITDKQRDNCGYDILARRRRAPSELHVEVKGTSCDIAHFYMSRNEKDYMRNPKWRLLIVTSVLDKPKVSLMTEKEAVEKFEFIPYAWEAVSK